MTDQVSHDSPDLHEISEHGQRILESLPADVERAHRGKFVAIDVESEEYFIGDTAIKATKQAQVHHPQQVFFLGRIGYRTAYTFKGRR